MKIVVTASEINEHGDWDNFCELRGLNPWCMKEGMMDSSEEFQLELAEVAGSVLI